MLTSMSHSNRCLVCELNNDKLCHEVLMWQLFNEENPPTDLVHAPRNDSLHLHM